jgi:predicted O-methyltransferase YrrM
VDCTASDHFEDILVMSVNVDQHSAASPRTRSYRFSQDWFSNHIPAWERVLSRTRPLRLIEIGCFEGRATTYIIQRCSEFGPLTLCCIDTWSGSVDLSPAQMVGVEDRFDNNVALAIGNVGAKVNFRKLKQPSSSALVQLLSTGEKRYDLIYIDGSHTAADVLLDAVLAFRLLRIGGIMIMDDYLWTMEPQRSVDLLNTPKLAIDAFTSIYMRKLRILSDLPNTQCFVEKIAA